MAHTTLLEPVRLDECNCGDPDKPDVGAHGSVSDCLPTVGSDDQEVFQCTVSSVVKRMLSCWTGCRGLDGSVKIDVWSTQGGVP